MKNLYPSRLFILLAAFLVAAAPGCKRTTPVEASSYNAADWEKQLKSPSLAKDQFVGLYAQAIAAKFADGKVQIVGENEITLLFTNGTSLQIFPDNAWTDVSQNQSDRPAICQKYLDSLAGSVQQMIRADDVLDTNSIVVVVRDTEFLNGYKKFENATNQLIYEPLVADIYVLYVIDSAGGMQYLREIDRQKLGLELPQLRQLGLRNLHRLLPEVKRAGGGPAYMLVADGNYESSLLLADRLWENQATNVPGDIVAAVPSRDTLLFTGSGSPEGLEAIRQAVAKIQDGGSHLVSNTLLVRRNGHWEKYAD